MQMTCPKCHGQMRQYERNGVTVDQCTDCRGIFLDRGELERLTTAENAWHGSRQQAAPPPPQQHGHHDSYPRHDQHRYDDHGHGHHKKHKHQESFFEDLFG